MFDILGAIIIFVNKGWIAASTPSPTSKITSLLGTQLSTKPMLKMFRNCLPPNKSSMEFCENRSNKVLSSGRPIDT